MEGDALARPLPSLLTLHRYWLTSSLNREIFRTTSPVWEKTIHPNSLIALHLWYSSLYVAIEGWRHEKMRDATVTKLLKDTQKLDRLREARNAMYHYDPEYLSPRFVALIQEPGIVAWVHEVHNAIGAALMARLQAATADK